MAQVKPDLRSILNALVFIVTIGALFVLNLATKPPDLLVSERRAPAKLPAFTWQSAASGSFMSRFEDYAADNFFCREGFRSIRAFTVFHILRQSDKSGLYLGLSGAGEFKPPDPAALRLSAEKIRKAADMLAGCDVYYALIPDKSIYAGRYLPGFDLRQAELILAEILGDVPYISLEGCLNAGSFYRTDLHWKQTAIADVAAEICGAMGAELDLYEYIRILAGEFKGVYAGQLALPMDPESMIYMDNPFLSAWVLNDATLAFEECPVYDLALFRGIDPYDLFLRGPQALVRLENPYAPPGDLYVFRDSFGSSLAPLLASAYSSVTLIDLRYIDMRILGQYMEFAPGADVLFLYSSQILNNPSVLKV
ncbi:MAG: hypothetical protein FWG28_01305 [Clostridiales bacterium]|nr:hypothetical protein [Clostridiales bacterium]